MAPVTRGIYHIEVSRKLCKLCGVCVAWCPQNVLEGDEAGFPLAPRLDQCINCKLCERHCPDFAIEVRLAALEIP
jgi:2-oxoglutarate ferredoxin oxidoreductase subunit delta